MNYQVKMKLKEPHERGIHADPLACYAGLPALDGKTYNIQEAAELLASILMEEQHVKSRDRRGRRLPSNTAKGGHWRKSKAMYELIHSYETLQGWKFWDTFDDTVWIFVRLPPPEWSK